MKSYVQCSKKHAINTLKKIYCECQKINKSTKWDPVYVTQNIDDY